MSDCIFCDIVDGEIPATKVYEDDDVVAFLDAEPLAQGHTLVIPKQHATRLQDLSEEQAADYFRNVPQIAAAVEEAVDADGTTVVWNNGEAAGQEVMHLHLHIVPRSDEDSYGPVHTMFDGPQPVADDEQGRVANRIRDRL